MAFRKGIIAENVERQPAFRLAAVGGFAEMKRVLANVFRAIQNIQVVPQI